jgi:hypothetical protein
MSIFWRQFPEGAAAVSSLSSIFRSVTFFEGKKSWLGFGDYFAEETGLPRNFRSKFSTSRFLLSGAQPKNALIDPSPQVWKWLQLAHLPTKIVHAANKTRPSAQLKFTILQFSSFTQPQGKCLLLCTYLLTECSRRKSAKFRSVEF